MRAPAMDTPRNIIADYLPLGPDEWIKDRFEHAAGIIEALAHAGYTIVPEARRFQDYPK